MAAAKVKEAAAFPARLVCVHWLDAATVGGWSERRHVIAEIGRGQEVWSTGFVVADDPSGILLTQGLDAEGKVLCASQFIPRAMIYNVSELGAA